MPNSAILQHLPLTFPWPTLDPFLFCAHHDDHYPPGNEHFGPAASLAGRPLGSDFSRKHGWSMYHGEVVPGFPAHPHRGFETVTLVREGWIDHADSLGAAARFGQGDAQWLTAGKGITHAEMFPLLSPTTDNPVELFQIWLNLPAARKMAEPHFTMFWEPTIPGVNLTDLDGRAVHLRLVTGTLPGHENLAPPAPPPASWAATPDADVAIWTLKLAPGANWTLPAAQGQGTRRMLYFFAGGSLQVDGTLVRDYAALELDANRPVALGNGPDEAELLLLQGRPIGEPVAQHGPFVMNTRTEIQQAFLDYQRTHFGHWQWPRPDPVHGPKARRFARYPDGTEQQPQA